jgi:hypothetical protein
MAKLTLALIAFLVWAGVTLAQPTWGMAAFLWFPLLGAAVVSQLIIFRLIADKLKDK